MYWTEIWSEVCKLQHGRISHENSNYFVVLIKESHSNYIESDVCGRPSLANSVNIQKEINAKNKMV